MLKKYQGQYEVTNDLGRDPLHSPDGMSYSEIAKELGITKQAVHQVAIRAMNKLRENIAAGDLARIKELLTEGYR